MARDHILKNVDPIDLHFLLLLSFKHFVLAKHPEVVIVDHKVLQHLSNDRNRTHVNCKPEEATLKEEVQVAVDAAMCAPVIHFQFTNQWPKHRLQHRKSFGRH